MIPWQQLNPFVNRTFPLLSGGRELFGTVIKQGRMEKTVTVKCDFKHWNGYASKVLHSSSKFLAHDHDESTRCGDKVVIAYAGGKISPRKHYYVRNIVHPFPRMPSPQHSTHESPQHSLLLSHYKQELQALRTHTLHKTFKNISQKQKHNKSIKAKAMSRAIHKLDKIKQQQ